MYTPDVADAQPQHYWHRRALNSERVNADLLEALEAIQEEISGRDLSKVSTERLMDLQLRYFGELKTEYVATATGDKTGIKLDSKDIVKQLQLVLERYKAGEIDEAQAKQEQTILQSMLKGIEQTELATKLEHLEAIVRSRR